MQFIGYAICGNIFPLCYKQIKLLTWFIKRLLFHATLKRK